MNLKLAILLMFVPSALQAGSFNDARSRSLFTDIKANRVGDLLTVLIIEDARASNTAKTVTKKDSKVETSGGPGLGQLDFIPMWGFSGENSSEYDGEGQLQKSGSVRAKMTVKVIAVNDNGDLVVEGNRVIGVNADKEALFLSGIVRTRDVSPFNTVYSYQIGEAQVSFKGKGQTHDGARPGILTRIMNWIF